MHWIESGSALGREPWLGTYSVRGLPIALLILSVHVVEVVCPATRARRSVLPRKVTPTFMTIRDRLMRKLCTRANTILDECINL